MGKMKFRFDDTVKYNEPNLVQVNIRHPNESGLAMDFDASRVPQFVRSVVVTYDSKPVMTAEVDFSLSDNPTFRFWFVPRKSGELRVEVEDTHDQRYVQTIPISEGAQLPGG
jgi:sulfur-oxidizing protein SoxY